MSLLRAELEASVVSSEDTYRAFAVDRTTKPTVHIVLSQAHPEDRAAIQRLIERITREVEAWNFEQRLLMPAGAVKRSHVLARAVHDDATEDVRTPIDGSAHESRRVPEHAYEIQALNDRLQSENIVLREEIDKTSMFEEIVGTSPDRKSTRLNSSHLGISYAVFCLK